ncbi:Neuron navigator 3, partial [Goodea atripinnis]
LPGPSRVPAAGSGASRSPGSSNLNRRSQSFNSIDKSKPLQYSSGNDRGEKHCHRQYSITK